MPKIFLRGPAHDGRKLHPRGPCDWPEGVDIPSTAKEFTEEAEKAHEDEQKAKEDAKNEQLSLGELTPKTKGEKTAAQAAKGK